MFFDLTEICYTDEDIVRVIEKESMDAIVIGSDAVCRHFPFWYVGVLLVHTNFLKMDCFLQIFFQTHIGGAFIRGWIKRFR